MRKIRYIAMPAGWSWENAMLGRNGRRRMRAEMASSDYGPVALHIARLSVFD